MQKIKKILDGSITFFTCSLMLIMVLLVIWQVFSRYILNSPSTFSEELLRYLLIWVSMLGTAYVFGRKGHLAIGFFVKRLPNKAHYAVNVFIELVLILFAAIVMVLGGTKVVMMTLGQISPVLGISMGYVYLSLPLSGALTIVYSIISLYEFINKQKSKDIQKDKINNLNI
ncbi:TRAP transporter small permease [Bacillus sp. 1780r2a1]|nr:TRAP transporter small permease [Bacillus sp. 1780r2a1]